MEQAQVESPAGASRFGFWRRIFAALADVLLLAAVGFAATIPFADWLMQFGPRGRLIGLAVSILYYGLLNSAIGGGATIGKRIFGLRVIRRDGRGISVFRSMLRAVVYLVPFYANGMDFSFLPLTAVQEQIFLLVDLVVVFGGGAAILYLYLANTRTRQSLHDLVAGTFVVRREFSKEAVTARINPVHVAVVLGWLAVLGGGGAYFGLNSFVSVLKTAVPQMDALTAVSDAATDEPAVMNAQGAITTMEVFGEGKTTRTTTLDVTVWLKGRPYDADALADAVARRVLAAEPRNLDCQYLAVSEKWGYDIGIVKYSDGYSVSHTPAEWRAIPGPKVSLTIDGIVDHWTESKRGVAVELGNVDPRFVADRSNTADYDELMRTLARSNRENIDIVVAFDPESGAVDPATNKPLYVMRWVRLDGRRITADETTLTAMTATPASTMLAKGIAYAMGGDPKSARPWLDRVLSDPKLPLPLTTLALRVRSATTEDDALSRWPVSDERDRGLVASLEDARRWAELAPQDIHAQRQIASDLEELGAYDESLAFYNAILKQWPQDSFWTYINIASVYRTEGDNARSLATLKTLSAQENATIGMPYHFHRAWTLGQMGDWNGAIAEYSAGFKFEPRYFGAYRRRACAYAAVGQLDKAIDDQRLEIKYSSDVTSSAPPSPGSSYDTRRAQDVLRTLQDALQTTPGKKIGGLCDGYWDWGDAHRTKSRLLPPLDASLPAKKTTASH